MPESYREDARRCRELLDRPLEPELRIQLRLWAAELDDIADAIERGAEASAESVRAAPVTPVLPTTLGTGDGPPRPQVEGEREEQDPFRIVTSIIRAKACSRAPCRRFSLRGLHASCHA